jgi:dipeptidyl aminopeptidase/acylaminoacyl peptidase
MRRIAPYGSWASPITPDLLVSGAVWLGDVWVDGDATYWSELRPSENGRVQLVCRRAGEGPVDLLPDGFSARTRVHEYGGGAWGVQGGVLFFANGADQRLYRLDPGDGGPGRSGLPRALSPEPVAPAALRYADGRITPDGRWLICVRERHAAAGGDGQGSGEAVNEVVAVPTDGSGAATPEAVRVLATGRDFVSAPRVSRDGRMLAWLTWDHPAMPWDGTELWIAHLGGTGGGERSLTATDARRVAGGPDESLVQPEWGRHGQLFVVSDRNDWWNVYRVDDTDTLQAVTAVEAEIGQPAWVFGQSRYGFTPDGTVVCTYTTGGEAMLSLVSADRRRVRTEPLPYTSVNSLRVHGDAVTFIAASAVHEPVVARVQLPAAGDGHARPGETGWGGEGDSGGNGDSGGDGDGGGLPHVVLHRPRDLGLDPALTSRGEPITFTTGAGAEAHGTFYPPTNPGFEAPAGEKPPLLVLSHGGPTSAANPSYSLGVQFWTSRGFAVVDVDYGGSTGYGRAYRQRLNGRWGIVDVEDCVAAANALVEGGLVDPDRLAIRGGSAGGFTTLAALTFTDTFRAGASHYGVADLAALAQETHKFESRYLDGLVGPWPEARDVYTARSPIHHTDRLSCPLILLQGLEDQVVPPRQAEMMVEALAAKGIPHAYLAFPGEQHGFRQAASITRAITAELYFYSRVFGFDLADDVEPVPIAFEEKLG